MLKNWLKIAFINYRKNALSTFINLFGLTVGLTGFMLILMHWNDEKSYESQNPQKEQIYLVENSMGKSEGYWSGATYPQMMVPKQQIKEIEDYVLFNSWYGEANMKSGNKIIPARLFDASPNFFRFFNYKSVAGNLDNTLSNTDNIAFSEDKAKEIFGSQFQLAIGKMVSYNGKNYTVSAIYKRPEGKSVIDPQAVILSPYLKANEDQWGNFNWTGMFKFSKDADVESIQQKIHKILYHNRVEKPAREKGITPQQYLKEGGGGGTEIALTRMDKMKFDAKGSGLDKTDKKTIYILMALSILIVILSAINFINLKTAQASQRAKEIGVRKAIGASKSALVLQFLVETFIMCFLAYILSLILTELLLPSYNKFLGKELTMGDFHIYQYSLVMMLLVTLISGIIPALYLSNFKPINTLKGNFSRSSHGIWLRNGILTLQLIISAFFITAGLIIHSQVKYMMSKDLGFSGDQSIVIPFNENKEKPYQFYELMKREISKIKGVEDITYSKQVIGNGSTGSSNVDDEKEKKSIMANHGSIDLNFFKFYHIKILAGRDFNPKLSSDTISNAIVNEAFIRKMGWTPAQALNKKVQPGFDDKPYTIIGVTKDYNQQSVADEVDANLFFFYGINWNRDQINNIQVKLNQNDVAETLERIKEFWEKKAEPGYAFQSQFIDKKFAKTFDKYKKQQTLFSILNAMVLMVALLGLFALSSLLIEQKLKTVAIKKSLGANEKTIVWDLTTQFLFITAIAVLISIPISYFFMNEWLKDFAYRIEMPWLPYALSFVLLLLLTSAVVSVKAYQATKVNLVKYLKYE